MNTKLSARVRYTRMATRAVVGCLVDEARKDRVLGLAAETAFFSVLSLFPALLVATSVLSVLDLVVAGDVAVRTQAAVTEGLGLVLTGEGAQAVRSVEAAFEDSRGGLLTFAGVGALLSLSGAWAVLIAALNEAYDTAERRTWLRRRLLGLGLALASVVVVAVALTVLVIGPLLGRGEQLAALVGLGQFFTFSWNVLRLPLLFFGVLLWVMAVFQFAPNRKTTWKASLPGALATSVMWLLATAGFSVYLSVMGDRNLVLGAFGGGAAIMIWAYLLSVALLLGGELNAILERRREQARETQVP